MRRRTSTPGPLRRTRKRLAITVGVAVIAAIVVGEVIDDVVKSSSGAQHRITQTWDAVASPLIVEENAMVGTLDTFRTTAASSSATPSQNDITLSLLSSTLERERQALSSVVVAPPSARVRSLLDAVVTDRADAIASINDGYGLATASDHNVNGATTSLASAGAQLAASDAAYRSLLLALRPYGGRGLLPAKSVWLGSPSSWSSGGASRFASALGTANQLTASSKIDLVSLSINPTPDHISGLPSTPTTSTTTTTTTTTIPFGATGATGTFGNSGAFGPSGATGASGVSGTTGTSGTTTTTTTTTIPVTRINQVAPPGAVAELIPTETIKVTAIVRDPGNVALSDVTFAAALTPTGKGAEHAPTPSATIRIGSIEPLGSKFVTVPTFAVDQKVNDYVLRVVVSAAGVPNVIATFQIRISG